MVDQVGGQKHHLQTKDRHIMFAFSIQGDVCFDKYRRKGRKGKEGGRYVF